MTKALTRRVLDVLARHAPAQRPHWESMLIHALDTEPAVFARPAFADHYRTLAANADWFADSLVANACLEGYGSQQILLFASRLANAEHAQLARRHALDESRHATVFVLALDLVFPGLLASQDQEVRSQVRAMQPFMTEAEIRPGKPVGTSHAEDKLPVQAIASAVLSPADAIAEIMQVHLTEIRALILQDLVREAFLRHAPLAHVDRLLRISDRLIADEARHIAYCADIIEEAANSSPDASGQLHEEMTRHMRSFNDLTREELERQAIEL